MDKPRVLFHYEKSNLFRVVHADGAWGGLTPDLDVFFTFFNSRPPIPQILVHEIEDDGHVGEEILDQKVGKDGIVREVEVGVVMSAQHVEALIAFLQDRLESIKKIKSSLAEERETR